MSVAPDVCPPQVLARIADLELVARIVVEGLVSGLHRSPFHGYSAEFSQYRHYRQGDDLKHVDWKLVARTDRIYTKQYRETTNMPASIVLDSSASMSFPAAPSSRDDRPPSKFRYGVIAAAALAQLISAQGDAVGLLAGGRYIASRAGRPHLRGVLAALAGVQPGGSWSGAETVRRAAERLSGRGLLLVISDFYDDEDRMFEELRRAARRGHEVVLFQLLSREEIDLPYRQDLEFTDLETGRSLAVNAGLARRDYKDGMSAFLERWHSRAGSEGFQYSLVITDTPPALALRNFLLARGTS
ncbi:MAG TPA: DUF58 domain-containing protein [Vicinamibacterales bacterium]